MIVALIIASLVFYVPSLMSYPTATPFDTVTSVHVISPATTTPFRNFTAMQGAVTYIVLQANLPCFTDNNCNFSVSKPFSLWPAPAEVVPIPDQYYIYSTGPVSYLNPGLRPFYHGNMLLWIKAPDSIYTGILTITIEQ